MCGIGAIYRYGAGHPDVEERELQDLSDAVRHRGPDGDGMWVAPHRRVGLAHRRLAIIDVGAGGAQPMHLEQGALSLTFNGQIYNYRELRRSLTEAGHIFRSNSDTEVLLQAYQRYGMSVVEHIRGMYAFAIWDERRGGLFLARDPHGVKPLYYADDGQQIVAASEVKALQRHFGGKLTACPVGQVSFLLWGSVLEPYTLSREIRALPAGTTMWIDGRGSQPPRRYWSVTETLRAAQDRAPTSDLRRTLPTQVREFLRDVLVDSIRHHLVSDVPVGVFLSGGRDSATIVGLAAEERLGDLRTMTLGFDELQGTAADEVVPARVLAASYGASHTSRQIGAPYFADKLEAIVAAMDQPSIDGINVYAVSEMAATAGLKVAISGLGADELFAGYPSFGQIPPLVRRLRPLDNAPRLGRALRRVSLPLLRRITSPKYAGIFEYGTSFEGAYLLRRGLFMPWELPEILDPETIREGWGALAPRLFLRPQIDGLRDPRAVVTSLEMTTYMRNQLLRDSDWAGMAHALEIRVPFVDRTLLTSLAPFLMGPTQLTKQDMIGTLRRPLPAAIARRPKTGFGVPVRSWLLGDQGARGASGDRGLRGWAKLVLKHKLAHLGQ